MNKGKSFEAKDQADVTVTLKEAHTIGKITYAKGAKVQVSEDVQKRLVKKGIC